MDEWTDTDAALRAGMEAAKPKAVKQEDSYAVIPRECLVEDLERYKAHPDRIKQHMLAQDVESFCNYVNDFKGERTRVFAWLTQPDETRRPSEVRAVFDHHLPENPAWGEHLAAYIPEHSLEWKRWAGRDGNASSQHEYAAFVEDNLAAINSPPAAEMMEIARRLEATRSVEFASSTRTQSGATTFTYNESDNATAGRGKITVPETFTIGIPIFVGGPSYKITCKLRYRISKGGLLMWHVIQNRDYLERDAFDAVVDRVAERTGLRVDRMRIR